MVNDKYCIRCHDPESTPERVSNLDNLSPYKYDCVRRTGTGQVTSDACLFPRAVAEKLVRANDTESQQSALLESEVYRNGEPFTLWLTGDDAPEDVKDHYMARHRHGNFNHDFIHYD
ncbi:MAG: hypothetical protein WA672_08880 [Candidatus Angelobacter sp.]